MNKEEESEEVEFCQKILERVRQSELKEKKDNLSLEERKDLWEKRVKEYNDIIDLKEYQRRKKL